MEEQTFETRLRGLQTVVEKLESGHLTLEEALSHFEKGIELSHQCAEFLTRAEARVEKLVQKNGEFIREEPFLLAHDGS
ncbi:MAG: exodeoxyribonuclease VII small subunit [Candidatus Cloacimonetes bacterium 4572_55]|nr:MAG: exodeoxyribonuclease VII small subunit [Candidatus Cloacimonetes bacterium 4572_55]